MQTYADFAQLISIKKFCHNGKKGYYKIESIFFVEKNILAKGTLYFVDLNCKFIAVNASRGAGIDCTIFNSNRNTKGIILFFVTFINLRMKAQLPLMGNYRFHRQDMVAGFSFSTNWKFILFYPYGVADRSASGSFSISGNTLHLKSYIETEKAFAVKSQSKEGSGYQI